MIRANSLQQGLIQVKPPVRAKICICHDGVNNIIPCDHIKMDQNRIDEMYCKNKWQPWSHGTSQDFESKGD